jgi:integrase
MKIADIRRHHVQAFIDDMKAAGNSPHAVCYSFGLIRNAMNEAVNRGIIPVSYAVGVALPKKTPKKTVIFTKNEQAAFMDTIKGHRLEAAFILAITTGMREGELAGLMWSDYNKGRIAVNKDVARVNLYDSVTHEKTGSRVIIQDSPKTVAGVREIPLLPIAIDALKRHRMKQNDEKMKNRRLYADNGLIFCNEIGCIYEPTYYYKLLQKTLDRVGLKRIKFHALRATFATRGLEAEIPTKSIQSMLGHETPEMTMHYQQLLEEQALVEIAKLEKMF